MTSDVPEPQARRTLEAGGPRPRGASSLKRRLLLAGAVVAIGAATIGGLVATRYVLPGVDDATLDTYRRSDVEFIAQLGMPGALDVVPSSLKEAITMSSVVLVGEIVDVRPTEPVTGEAPSDKVYGLGVVVRPLDVLQGSLPLRFRDELTIDLPYGETDPASGLDEVRERLPKGLLPALG